MALILFCFIQNSNISYTLQLFKFVLAFLCRYFELAIPFLSQMSIHQDHKSFAREAIKLLIYPYESEIIWAKFHVLDSQTIWRCTHNVTSENNKYISLSHCDAVILYSVTLLLTPTPYKPCISIDYIPLSGGKKSV